MTREVRLVFIRAVALTSLGATLAYLLIAPSVAILIVIAGVLWLVWRFDNWTGSCMILAVLLLLVLAALGLLVVLAALPP
jgi:hypothetical protein